MFKNYLKIAFRNFRNNKIFSFINISGVAISIAACFLILKYAGFELSYDRFHEKTDNLYRLTNDRFQNGKLIQHGVITYPSVAKTMYADFPEISNYTRIIQYTQMFVRADENSFEETFVFADSAFLSMFSFPLIIGDPNTALANPYSMLLSETTAEKYYGKNWKDQNILGKTLHVDNQYEVSVSGVFSDVPDNSHMDFDFLVSYSTLGKAYGSDREDSWTNSNFMSYLELIPGADPKEVEQKFAGFSEKYFNGDKVNGYHQSFFLQPIKSIHLHSNYEYETWVHGNNTAVMVLLLIAALILIIAWLNYINLSTARSLERAKEVGMRKVMGAQKSHLIKQFLFESILYNIIGLLIAIVFVELSEAFLSRLLDIQFSHTFMNSELFLVFLGLFLLGTFASGFYPAFILSSFQTLSVLKGKFTRSASGRRIRKYLVVFQFALSFVLIAGTYAVYTQINYMMEKNLGMNIEQTLAVKGPYLTQRDSTYINNARSFKTELLRFPSISHVTASIRLPGRRTGRIFNIEKLSGDSQQKFTTSEISVGDDFFKTFEMEILTGRGFAPSDYIYTNGLVLSAVINKSAAKLFGFDKPEDAFQQRIKFWGRNWEIVGIVTDHHQQSLHVPVEPIVFTPQYSTSNYFFLKVNTKNLPSTLAEIEKVYSTFFPGNLFNHFFLDDYFNEQYLKDKNFRIIFTLFASLGVLLSCMGLFGLVFFTTSQRTKEIGIRKVVGASTTGILGLLLKDFTKLAVIAGMVGSPFAYFAMEHWLSGYAYRINIGWLMFALPAILVFAITVITVSTLAIRAAKANPVEALKYE